MWRDVAEKAPHNWEAHYTLGTALIKERHYAEAIAPLRRALAVADAVQVKHHPAFRRDTQQSRPIFGRHGKSRQSGIANTKKPC